MSKNKPYHNYQNYQNNSTAVKDNETTTAIPEEVLDEETAETTDVEEVIEDAEEETEVKEIEEYEEPIQETSEPETIPTIGIVSDCAKLRVRAAANTEADILCELESGKEVVIDESASTKDFYKVCTETGIEGFCMKKFIKI